MSMINRDITERDLFLPALYVISQRGSANTTQIKEELVDAFKPTGHDGEQIPNRADTFFTQKVRNLMGSHYWTNGMSINTTKDERGYFHLTPQGQDEVERNRDWLRVLFTGDAQYEERRDFAGEIYDRKDTRRTLEYREDESVFEGRSGLRVQAARERSRRLREAAVAHYTVDGRIRCAVCGMDFYETYGELGRGYIQMHHETPISRYSDQGEQAFLRDAVENVKPLCANCHCMIHRRKDSPLTVDELKNIVKNETSRG